MQAMDVFEAQLFRLLQGIFGEDNVLPYMRLKAITGGKLPDLSLDKFKEGSHDNLKCLFTVVDYNDEPKMVIDIDADEIDSIDILKFEKQEIVSAYLKELKIKYLLISLIELEQILDVTSELTLANCLHSKIV